MEIRSTKETAGSEQETAADAKKVEAFTTWAYDRNGLIARKLQSVITEKPVTLYINGREILTLMCAGHHLEEMAIGFAHAEGFLRSRDDLVDVQLDEVAGAVHVTTLHEASLASRLWEKRTVTSGCGKGSLFYYSLDALLSRPVVGRMRLSSRQILERMEDLHHQSEVYRETHGVHNSALASAHEVLLFRNDIGRHNAVDMIVGYAFLNGIALEDKMLLTTGRLTSEIIIKSSKIGIPVLVSRNTASTLAIELARSLNITLIGYVRGGKFLVYSGNERIIESGESLDSVSNGLGNPT